MDTLLGLSLSTVAGYLAAAPLGGPALSLSAGFAAGAMLCFGRRAAPALWLAAFAGGFGAHGIALAALLASIEVAGAWIVLAVVRRLSSRFQIFALIPASLAGGLAGALNHAATHIGGTASLPAFLQTTFSAYAAYALGILAVAPAFLAWHHRRQAIPANPAIQIAVAAMGAILLAWTWLTPTGAHFLQLGLLAFLAVWMVLPPRFFAWLAPFTVTVAAFALTHGRGVFSTGTLASNVPLAQLLLLAVALTGVVLCSLGHLALPWRRPLAVLAAGWLVLGTGFAVLYRLEAREELRVLADRAQGVTFRIRERFIGYENLLRAGAGLYHASRSVEIDEWQAFVNSLQLSQNFPGVNGIGWIHPIARDQEAATLHHLAPLGLKDVRIHDVPEKINFHPVAGLERYVILFIEPPLGNERAIGLDIGTERRRRAAAELSRDTGLPTITDAIFLIQDETQRQRPSFLYFYPIYRKGVPLSTVAERRAAFYGWIYSPMIFENILDPLIRETRGAIDFQMLADGDSAPLYASGNWDRNESQIVRERLTFGQKTFDVRVKRGPGFSYVRSSALGWTSAVGTLFLLLVVALLVNIESVQGRVKRLAEVLSEEVRQNQMQLAQSAKLSTLGQMAGGIAHEINNPLAVISGYAQQIAAQTERAEPNVAKIRAQIGKVSDTIERIAKIVRGLRSFSREGDNLPLEVRPLGAILESTLDLCRERFRIHDVELRIRTESQPQIRCRDVQISQVVLNLLQNAFDAVEGLPHKWVAIETRELGDLLEISVTDAGPGIPPEIADRIMDPFFTTKDVGKGTGLGLSISVGILADHGGRLWLDRTHAHTRFVAELPIACSLRAQGLPKAAA
jgi:signal transduction histidine kinase